MLTSIDEMKDKEFLRMWIENEAGLVGGLFGMFMRHMTGTDRDEDQTEEWFVVPNHDWAFLC